MEGLKKYMTLPQPNSWHEDLWFKWYCGLSVILLGTDVPKTFIDKVNEIDVSNGHDKHWSRWLMWYEDLQKILVEEEKDNE